MQVDGVFDDGKAQTRTLNRSDIAGPVERRKQVRKVVLWDANAPVRNLECNMATLR